MSLKEGMPFFNGKEVDSEKPNGYTSLLRYYLIIGAWGIFYFSAFMFSSFLGMKSEIVNDANYFIMPLLLIFLEFVLNFLKKKISLPSFLKKVLIFQFTFFLLLHIFLALYFSLKENSEVDGFLGILVLSSGYLFILGRFGLIKSLLFSASCLIFFLFLKFRMSPEYGLDDKIFIFFYVFYSASFSLLNSFLKNSKDKEKETQEKMKSFNERLEKSVKEKTYKMSVLNQSLIGMMVDVNEEKLSREMLLENLAEGYMVFNKERVVEEGATAASMRHFETKTEGKKIEDILRLTDHARDNFLKWCENVWKGSINFKDLLPLAPKTFIGGGDRYIKLDFRPIYKKDNKEIEKLICIASDITNEKRLEEKANKEKLEVQMFLKILDQPLFFLNLIEDAKDSFSLIRKNDVMDVDLIFRNIHNLKANFSRFHVSILVQKLHKLEEILDKHRAESFFKQEVPEELNKSFINAENQLLDFLKSEKTILDMARRDAKSSESDETVFLPSLAHFISERFGENSDFYTAFKEKYLLGHLSDKLENFIPLVSDLSKAQGKHIIFAIEEAPFKVDLLRYKGLLNACTHILRNAVDHGIESPEEREEQEKTKRGMIKASFKDTGIDMFQLIIEDDGKGIDPELIRSLVEKKNIISKELIKKLNDKEIIQFIFEPGLSSRENVSNISGRGVGAEIIKIEAEKIGGEVRVISKFGKGTAFILTLPIFK
ncbi:MAG: hypothetical protein CME68_04495 [Halobacteriovoraceae bacterium]|nr:hypothetical protein [Halobacteriovoraceae bacterium]